MVELVLMCDPRVTAIPTEPKDDPFVDLREFGEFFISDLRSGDDGAYAFIRSELSKRLLEAETCLPPDHHLLLIEGYRSFAVQSNYFESYRDEMARANPAASDGELDKLTSRHVSPPDVAPHVSGAAIDLTLCNDAGREVDMGTPVNATPEQSNGACYFNADNISIEARHNREILGTALRKAGFVNYPTEWWHWSFGDRYWALLKNEPAAHYISISR